MQKNVPHIFHMNVAVDMYGWISLIAFHKDALCVHMKICFNYKFQGRGNLAGWRMRLMQNIMLLAELRGGNEGCNEMESGWARDVWEKHMVGLVMEIMFFGHSDAIPQICSYLRYRFSLPREIWGIRAAHAMNSHVGHFEVSHKVRVFLVIIVAISASASSLGWC